MLNKKLSFVWGEPQKCELATYEEKIINKIGKLIIGFSNRGKITRRGYKLRLNYAQVQKYITSRLEEVDRLELEKILNSLRMTEKIDIVINNNVIDTIVMCR